MNNDHVKVDATRLNSNEDGMGDMDEPSELGVKQRNRFDYFSSNAQGAQGSQMRIESSDRAQSTKFKTMDESPDPALGFHSSKHKNLTLFDPNSTQTNALLHVKDNRFNLFLQQVYYSEKCSWFYIGLLVLSFGLILVTIFDGF